MISLCFLNQVSSKRLSKKLFIYNDQSVFRKTRFISRFNWKSVNILLIVFIGREVSNYSMTVGYSGNYCSGLRHSINSTVFHPLSAFHTVHLFLHPTWMFHPQQLWCIKLNLTAVLVIVFTFWWAWNTRYAYSTSKTWRIQIFSAKTVLWSYFILPISLDVFLSL